MIKPLFMSFTYLNNYYLRFSSPVVITPPVNRCKVTCTTHQHVRLAIEIPIMFILRSRESLLDMSTLLLTMPWSHTSPGVAHAGYTWRRISTTRASLCPELVENTNICLFCRERIEHWNPILFPHTLTFTSYHMLCIHNYHETPPQILMLYWELNYLHTSCNGIMQAMGP